MSQEIEQIELSIEEAKKLVDRRDQLRKLTTNREFKKIFLDGYFQEEAVRMTHILADPALTNHRQQIIEALTAISHVRNYLHQINLQGDMAEREISEMNVALDEIREESN